MRRARCRHVGEVHAGQNRRVTPLSGTQTLLSAHGYTADIASVGATLRTLSFEGRDLVAPFEADQVRPSYFGAILAPWPNRIVDGHYRLDDEEFLLALNEPDRGHALHGLAAWLDFAVIESSNERVALRARIPAQKGYPFPIDLEVEYRIDESGLTTVVTATNDGTIPAPYGVAPHPYLIAGRGPVDEWTLDLPAFDVLETDERLTPGTLVRAEAEYDYRTPALIGSAQIDNAFTDLIRDDDGRATVRLTAADERGVAISWGEGLDWVQIFTGDLPTPEWRRRAVAVEPMTCAPDAFNSGVGLIMLAPGASHTAEWVISAI